MTESVGSWTAAPSIESVDFYLELHLLIYERYATSLAANIAHGRADLREHGIVSCPDNLRRMQSGNETKHGARRRPPLGQARHRLVLSPDQIFRARQADSSKNSVWTLSLRKLGQVYIMVGSKLGNCRC